MSLKVRFMQKTELEQVKEKELAEAKQELSEKEQEIQNMRQKVSFLCHHCPWHACAARIMVPVYDYFSTRGYDAAYERYQNTST